LVESKVKGLEEKVAAATEACAGLTSRLLNAQRKHGNAVVKMKKQHEQEILDSVAEATTAAAESLSKKHTEQVNDMKNTNIVFSAFFMKLYELILKSGLSKEDLPEISVGRGDVGVFDKAIVTTVFGAVEKLLDDVGRLQNFTGSPQWLLVRQKSNPILVQEVTGKVGFKTGVINDTVQCLFGLITMFAEYHQSIYVLSGNFQQFFKYYHPLRYEHHYKGSSRFSNQFSMKDIVSYQRANIEFLKDLCQCPQQLCNAARYSSMSFNPIHVRISTIMLSAVMQRLENKIQSLMDEGLPDDLRPAVAASAIECLSFYNTQFDDGEIQKLYILAGSDSLRFKEMIFCSVADQDNAAVLDRLWVEEQTSVMAHLFTEKMLTSLLKMQHTKTIRAAFVESNCKFYFQEPTISFMQLYADKHRRENIAKLLNQDKDNRGELDNAYRRILNLMQVANCANDANDAAGNDGTAAGNDGAAAGNEEGA